MAGRLKLIVAFWVALSLVCPLGLRAQSRRLIVVKPGDAELKKTAARVRMCPEQLQNIRQVLEEAADLLPESASGPSGLPYLLFRFNRPAAEDAVVNLVQVLGSKARQAANHQDYQRLTTSAIELVSALERYNPTLAEKLEDQWPQDPSPRPSTASAGGVQTYDYLAQRQLLRMAQRNPEEALRQLDSIASPFQYSMRSTLVNGLFEKGMEAEARRIVDETLAVPIGGLSQPNVMQFAQFARTALEIFPDYSDRVQQAIAAAYQGLAQAGDPSTRPYTLPNGQAIQVSGADQFLLTQIMMMNNNQQVAARLAELSPAISERMRSAGGYSALFRYNARQWRQSRRELIETPDDQVESKFGDNSTTDLMRSASGACYEFPEKAEKIFDLALSKIQAEKDFSRAANDFENASRNCAHCVGLLPDKWMSAGKELLEKIRQEEQETLPPVRSDPRIASARSAFTAQTVGFRLESLLLAFKADTDFAGALQDVHAIEDKAKRYELLMRIAQYLGSR